MVSVEKGGEPIAGALMLCSTPQIWKRVPWRMRGYRALECLQGPVLPKGASPELLSELLGRVEELAGRLGASRISFIARPTAAIWSEDLPNVFLARGYSQAPMLSSLIDLTRSEEMIFASFEHAARKGVRKCEKNGVTISECRDWESYYHDFLLPFYETVGHENVAPRSREVEQKVWDEESHSGLYRFFVARIGDSPVLATMGSYSFNGLATEIATGRTKAAVAINLPVQDLLHWEVFKVHRAAGDMFFDMAGFSAAPISPKEAGIRRFKEKWSGRTVEIPSYHRDLPTLANKALSLGRAVKRMVGNG